MFRKILPGNTLRKFSRLVVCQGLLSCAILPMQRLQAEHLPLSVWIDKTVSGKIVDENAVGLPGVSVVMKGSTSGTISDSEGKYTISVPDGEAVLIYSYVGYFPKEVSVSTSASIDVTMLPDVRSLNEVVVTALGIKKESKRLGYAVQELKGTELDKARETNFVSGLAGKVAGV